MAQPHLPLQLHNTIFQITLPSNPPRAARRSNTSEPCEYRGEFDNRSETRANRDGPNANRVGTNASRDRVNTNRDEHTLYCYFPGRLRDTRSASRANFG